MTRWSIPFAGFLLSLMGGFAYTWGVSVVPMMDEFGWSEAEAALPFSIFIIMFSLVMVPSGWLQDKIGPGKVSAFGAILFFVAYGLAALVYQFPYSWWLVITFGLIGGRACGLTYACIAPPAIKWFPDKPGVAVSLAVMGFGLSALFFAPIKSEYLIPTYGLSGTLLIIAILTSSVSLFAAWLIKNPPDDWKLPAWEGRGKDRQIKTTEHESTPRELISSSQFWIIWLTFALVIAGGLMCISVIPAYGEIAVGLSAVEAAGAIAIFAGFNGFGRPVAGFLSDRFGTIKVMITTYVVQTIVLLSFPFYATTLPTLYIATALLGWGFAVTLALFPVLTAASFGTRHMGVNYGIVFTAFGIGALAPTAGAAIYDATASYAPAFILAGIMAGTGTVLCIVLKKKYAL